jgi:putative tryptophan/tyrosine transport system substrate-binding protein
MTRSLTVLTLCAMLFALCSYAQAQQQVKKIARIGFLSVRAGIESREEAFRQGLRELGYTEGQTIAIEWRFAKGKSDRLTGLAADPRTYWPEQIELSDDQ